MQVRAWSRALKQKGSLAETRTFQKGDPVVVITVLNVNKITSLPSLKPSNDFSCALKIKSRVFAMACRASCDLPLNS